MKRYLFVILPLLLLLTGCGHKSKTELVDIEQFKCQDSIQTVFDVFGGTKLQKRSTFSKEYIYEYEYNSLNLWGYDGNAIFRVRSDKDTIQDFECHLTLNKKECKDVLRQLSDKHGQYEKKDYGNQIAYVWECADETASDPQYYKIVLSDYGKSNIIIEFSDEWSLTKDEAYFQYLEEKFAEDIIADKTYEINNDSFRFVFSKTGDEYSLHIFCDIENKLDAFYTHTTLNAIMNSDEEALAIFKNMFSYSISIGDGSFLSRTNDILFLMSNTGEIFPIDEYFSADWLVSEASSSSDYGAQVTNFLVDFLSE